MFLSRFYSVTHDGDERVGLMAWLDDGRTLQYLAETGEFHYNPALGDDLIHEQYNQYEQLETPVADELLSRVQPLDPNTLQWLASRLAAQPSSDRFDPQSLGLRTLEPGSSRTPKESFQGPGDVEPSAGVSFLPPVKWLAELGGLEADSPDVVSSTVAELVTKAIATEPGITADLVAASSGQELLGLEHRVKSPTSLARKVDMWFCARTITADRLEPLRIVTPIPDIVRYTLLVADHDEMLRAAQNVASHLRQVGHRLVSSEQSYVDGNFYKGFKSVWISSSTQRWELQFRSNLNIEYKDRAYPYYKASRDLSRPVSERRDALVTTTRIYSQLPLPAGLSDGAQLAGVPIRTRVYASPFE